MSKRLVLANRGAVPAEGPHTRRAALGALAAASVFAIPKVGRALSPPDPVFAAIRRHRAAWSLVGAMAGAADEVAAKRGGRKVTQADRDAYDRASAVEHALLRELLAAPPTSAEGMRAAIAYVLGFDDGCFSDMSRPFLETLLKSPLLEDGLISSV